ncbi:MAG: Methionine aminopeptidase 1 [Lentisphaerae bacterium ADurb.Bin242]|nr:MAG: Methionine aminopeptidase 1 [Lentisphaerae bacterium ADurb.Bin242]
MAAEARERICKLIRSGMTTADLDELGGEVIRSMGGVPSFLNYRGYPGNICISLNDEVVHGIGRRDRFILKGDIVSVDVGVSFEGGVGDTAKTVYVGDDPMPANIERLLRFTESALEAGLAAAHPGGYVQDISRGVEMEAKRGNLGIVEEYVGHGCGMKLHEPPDVPNYVQHRKGPRLVSGMVLCVEPMLNLGSRRVYMESDGWTVRTRDGEPSAHFEHMLLITENGTEVLTRV